ncbi:hypothetical protein EXS74_02755 [Candidatus Woesearchaeota archaeon]|nr:hypothetical protein [Candidatus Woesearchaeota archaeon]
MNKRALIFLYICSFSFIIAVFVFYGSVGKQTPGGESWYLGEKEIQVFETYQQAEQERYAIELAATLSAKQASQDNFQADFEKRFGQYLKEYSLEAEKYSFTYQTSEGTMTIVGTTEQVLEFKEERYIYTLTPEFSITIPYTGESTEEDESSTTTEGVVTF